MTLLATIRCESCGATPDLPHLRDRAYWVWPDGDAWAGEGACSHCWNPNFVILHSWSETDPRPILGPVRRPRDYSARDDFACDHPGEHVPWCFDCWLDHFCYECGGPIEGNHRSCFISPSEDGL